MRMIVTVLAGGLLATSALAQTSAPATTAPTTAPTTRPAAVAPAPSLAAPATTPGAAVTTPSTTGTPPAAPGIVNRNTGQAAASGDRNQAVATTGANAAQPAHGRNSFTMGEARRRLERRGFANVADLKKDGDGVWRGTAMKDGGKVSVWLDYKGNTGQS